MTTRLVSIFISLFIHIGLLLLLSTVNVPQFKSQTAPSIKAYIVSLPTKVEKTTINKKQKKQTKEQTSKTSKEASKHVATNPNSMTIKTKVHRQNTQQKRSASTNPTSNKRPIAKSEAQATSAVSTSKNKQTLNTGFKKIDLTKGLNSILQKQEKAYKHHISTTNRSSKRITVPKEHHERANVTLKTLKQSMQFSTYQYGDNCFKKVSIGAGVMQKRDLPDSFITPIECENTHLTKAYDKAMQKWLNK